EPAPGGGERRVLVAGLGKRDEFGPERARVAAAAVAARAKELGAVSLSWAAPEGAGVAGALVEGTLLRLYAFDRFKSKRGDGDDGIESLEIAGPAVDEGEVERAGVAAAAANAARDLQNLPANELTPAALAARAREIAAAHDSVEVEVFGRDQIEEMGMGALAAVAQGTYAEPQLIVLRYDGGGDGPHLGFVGKAVTFDTGGISIKPALYMEDMKGDMSGGAAVLAGLGAMAELGLPVRAIGVVGATENMVGGGSYRPGDIVRAMNGTTIEIVNTDAEGRLVLADVLWYARQQGATHLVDFATLTGAMEKALGDLYAGVFGNDDEWRDRVVDAGNRSGDLAWALPIHRRFHRYTDSAFADLKNSSVRGQAIPAYAAGFLQKFVGEGPWAHIDMAGPAFLR
ncbi:MAG: leucyl aminopeptidase family protein, partial [Thermoleophilia bacterium]